MEPDRSQQLDPASQSLSEALDLSLKILKGIMILLVLLFLSSGIFTVQENEHAIVLIFGKARGEDPNLKPGLHWTWPYPLSEVVKVPGIQQSFEVGNFWYSDKQQERLPSIHPSAVSPMQDGYCMTGDANIVHSKWHVRYKIQEPYLYLAGSEESDKFALNLYLEKREDELLHGIACNCIIRAIATFTAEDAIKTRKDDLRRMVQQEMEKELKGLEMGIKIEGVELVDIVPPRQVKDAFESVSYAEREFHKNIETAEKERTQILNQARAEATRIQKEAEIYSFETEREAEGDAQYFEKVLAEYRQNPDIFRQDHYQQMLEYISGKVLEVFLLRDTPRDLRIMLNRNPQLYRFKPPTKED